MKTRADCGAKRGNDRCTNQHVIQMPMVGKKTQYFAYVLICMSSEHVMNMTHDALKHEGHC